MKTAIVLFCLTTCADTLSSTERLRMRVSPAMTVAPALVRVEAIVERDAGNRTLRITAESDTFYRSSEIPLDGANSPLVSVFDFQSLPTGTYQVTGLLVGVGGQRAAAMKVVRVQPSPGSY
jgi:hypothetical protein